MKSQCRYLLIPLFVNAKYDSYDTCIIFLDNINYLSMKTQKGNADGGDCFPSVDLAKTNNFLR